MPLVPTILADKLREFMDESYAGFTGWPTSPADAAMKWANAIDAYTGSGANIFPPSTTGAAAKAVLESTLASMNFLTAMVQFDAAFLAYATTLGAGMAPAFVATPPPAPISVLLLALVPLAIGPPTIPASIHLTAHAAAFDTWFRTGTATPSVGGSPVPWA